ncbi:MAG: hypothetical protein HQ527_04190 [Cyanobacteria bacterium]|nr:hypothetical protein [Cyanobacteria bacterium bin.51]
MVEVRTVLQRLGGEEALVPDPLDGSRLWLIEAQKPSVQNLYFGRLELTAGDRKGVKDGITLIPA